MVVTLTLSDVKRSGLFTLCFVALQKKIRERIVFIILSITILLCILLTIGIDQHPILVLCGAASFGVAISLAILVEFIYGIKRTLYLKKHHSGLWKKTNDRSISRSKRFEVVAHIKSLNDPSLIKLSNKGDKYSKIGLLVWFILFLLFATGFIFFKKIIFDK